jgi:hypothetical protein
LNPVDPIASQPPGDPTLEPIKRRKTGFKPLLFQNANAYRYASWGWNGPQLVTRVASRFPQGGAVQVRECS